MYQSTPHEPPPPGNYLAGWWADLKTALALLSRLPITSPVGGALPRSVRAFPLVGLLIGLIGAVTFALASWLSLPGLLAAVIAVAATILATGAMHEDGLADVADGFGGGTDRDSKLAIMRDSRTGSYGALALILSVLLRVLALYAIAEPLIALGDTDEAGALVAGALIAAHAVSRAVLPVVMYRETLARDSGLAVAAGQPEQDSVLWSLGLGALIALLALGLGTGLIAFVVAGLAALAMTGLARRQIGGYTGDVLGAIQQLTEIAMLLAIVALR
ncbi:adenosylcobinamide-GDP ribazoletransferase [Rhodospirillaceae bacterium SYSU D60014]|uniref:adenosylcobinamide-GDP ribazoletransferase n=1 Tax=Virgifigura deserti TaxID=2268457 RepID=UPI000E674A4E